ncbi:MAG: TMEM165/GDT1 family protein [Candidatus Thorarchaeota archaeon]
MMPIHTFLSAMGLILLSELGDKTMFTTLCLSAQQHRPMTVLLASMLALTVATVLAVNVGVLLAASLPLSIIIPLSASLFIIMGIITLRADESNLVCENNSPSRFVNMFSLVLFSELGDKSQIVIFALSSTTVFPILVVLGALVGFLIVNTIGALIGLQLAERLPVRRVQILTGLVFIFFGIVTLLGVI